MVDKAKVEAAVKLLLEGIGEDVTREGLVDTPNRIARMYEEIYGGMEEDASVHLRWYWRRILFFIPPVSII